MTPKSYKIAYLGLGNMGLPISRNLVKYISENSLPQLLVWNRSKEKYAQIPEAKGVEQPEDVLHEGCNVVFTSLLNDEVAEEIYDKLFGAVKGKGEVVFVEHSTLNPKTSVKLAEKAKAAGATYLSAPVFGQPPAAVSKSLLCIVAGDKDAREWVKPIFEGIGRATIDFGDDVKKGAEVKLLGNMLILESIQVFSEIYALADATGVNAGKLHEMFQALIPAPPLLNYSNKISKGLFDGSAGFRLDGGMKDARHMASLRDNLAQPLPLPTLEKCMENMQKALDLQEGNGKEMDWSSLSVITRKDGGLEAFKEGSDRGRKAE